MVDSLSVCLFCGPIICGISAASHSTANSQRKLSKMTDHAAEMARQIQLVSKPRDHLQCIHLPVCYSWDDCYYNEKVLET